MGNRKDYIIKQIVKYAQKLDQKGFGANHDGNISAKCDDIIFATPTAVSKGDVVEEIIISLDQTGKQIAGIGKPFSEIKLHLAAYAARPDVKAVVHAHPPFATARGLLGEALYPMLPEAIVSIGDVVPVVEFAMPGDSRNDEIVAKALANVDVFMLPGNGVLAVGDNVAEAYLRLELAEHLAKIYYYAEIQSHAKKVGQPMALSKENIQALLKKRAAIGLGPKGYLEKEQTIGIDTIKNLIAEEIKKML